MTQQAAKKPNKKAQLFRLSKDCRQRLQRASKRTGKTMTRILEDAILAQVPMYLKEIAQ